MARRSGLVSLLVVASWLACSSSASGTLITFEEFDESTVPDGKLLTDEYKKHYGVTFEARCSEVDPADRAGTVLFTFNSQPPTAKSHPRLATLGCPFEVLSRAAIKGRFVTPQRSLSLWVRAVNASELVSGEPTAQLEVFASDGTLAAPKLDAEISEKEWKSLQIIGDETNIASFRLTGGDPGYLLRVDDLSFVGDRTKPTIELRSPLDGATYRRNERVFADYSCKDEPGGSGVPDGGCQGTTPVGGTVDTRSPGVHDFTVTARDRAGNASTVTVTYTVLDPLLELSPRCGDPSPGASHSLEVTVAHVPQPQDPEGPHAILRLETTSGELLHAGPELHLDEKTTLRERFDVPRQPPGEYLVVLREYDRYGILGGPIASAVFAVPCPTVTLEPSCGPPASGSPDVYSITVVGSNFPAGRTASVSFAGEPQRDVVVDGNRQFVTQITPARRPPGRYEVRVVATVPGAPAGPSEGPGVPEGPGPGARGRIPQARAAHFDRTVVAAATFVVPCPEPPVRTPAIALDPSCGPPAAPPDAPAIDVRGADFPPNVSVSLDYDGVHLADVRAAADGTLTAQLNPASAPGVHVVSARWVEDATPKLVQALFTVACAPTVSVSPRCGPARAFDPDAGDDYQISVNGSGFVPGGTTEVGFADRTVARAIPVTVDGTIGTRVRIDTRAPGRYEIKVRQTPPLGRGPLEFGSETVAWFRVPCGSIAVRPDCGSPAARRTRPGRYALRVRGRTFEPGQSVQLSLEGRAGLVLGTALAVADARGEFSHPLRAERQAPGTYLLRAAPLDDPTSEATTPFRVPCRPPKLSVSPALGPPGFVTVVVGRYFPAKARISLSWHPGIGVTRVRADARGRFRIPVLVFPHDAVGGRTLRATTETRYSRARDTYLVVPGSLQPSDFLVRR